MHENRHQGEGTVAVVALHSVRHHLAYSSYPI